MTETRRDPFASNYSLQFQPGFMERVNLARNSLSDRYFSAHQDQAGKEMKRNNDGVTWAGPRKFALPIQFVQEYMPNMRVLMSIENALSGICDWPTARKQAFQLKECIKYGGEAQLYKEVAQIGDLVTKIAKEKPYGERTTKINLLNVDWSDVYWNSEWGNGENTKELFDSIIKSLSNFAEGKYQHCIQDYPHEPFYLLQKANLSQIPPEGRDLYIGNLIKERYPILLEFPDLANNF